MRYGIRFAYPRAERVELARKRQAVGIFARSANILVFAKRCGVRFAYPRAERVELARKRQAVGIFAQRANILVPRQSRGGIRFAFAARKSVGAGAHDSPFARWIFRVVEAPTPTVEA